MCCWLLILVVILLAVNRRIDQLIDYAFDKWQGKTKYGK